MKSLRIAAAPVNQTPLDWRRNRENVVLAIREARQKSVDLLALPELSLSGYGAEDAFLWAGTFERSKELLLELLPETRGMLVCVGLPMALRGRIYNSVAVMADGQLVGAAVKRHLAGAGVHYEPRWFTPWPRGLAEKADIFGPSICVGDQLFELDGFRFGFEICEDAWVEDRPGRELAAQGADLILSPSASHFAFGKHEIRRNLVRHAAENWGVAYAYVNLLGNEAGRVIYDGDVIFAERGVLYGPPPEFGFRRFDLQVFDLQLEAQREYRELRLGARLSSDPEIKRRVTQVPSLGRSSSDTVLPDQTLGTPASLPETFANGFTSVSQDEYFARAVALGLLDYLEKSRAKGFVVSLSGGVDSAATLLLCRLAVHRAIAALGLEAFVQRFAYAFGEAPPTDEDAVVRRLITSVYQATAHSGPVTRHAACGLASALGVSHLEWDVEEIAAAYRARVEEALGRPLSWSGDDVPLQNIQARSRAPGIWMLANVKGALLLSTSNRSEAAVGYATMDGDTAGGLAPLSGVSKSFLRKWLLLAEERGVGGLPPVPALTWVNRQAPTAELRPPSEVQTDEADLMPYAILDAAEHALVVEGKTPHQVLSTLKSKFDEYSEAQLRTFVQRFFRLFAVNQWKRERYAPGFHVDDESLDPKTWCRFPILSGNFSEELAELTESKDEDGQRV